jgi:hypothetical protein
MGFGPNLAPPSRTNNANLLSAQLQDRTCLQVRCLLRVASGGCSEGNGLDMLGNTRGLRRGGHDSLNSTKSPTPTRAKG